MYFPENCQTEDDKACLILVPGEWALRNEGFDEERIMFVVYVDEAGTGSEKDEPVLVVSALLIDGDKHWREIEREVTAIAEKCKGEEKCGDFEFKACELFRGDEPPFNSWKDETRWYAQESFLKVIADHKLPFIWGAVDRAYLRNEMARPKGSLTLDAQDIAFALCLVATESWFCDNAPNSVGICIADHTEHPFRSKLTATLREYRKNRALPSLPQTQLEHFMDTLSFNASHESIGIQMADHCAYFLKRHLMKKVDSEKFYQIIKPTMGFGYYVRQTGEPLSKENK